MLPSEAFATCVRVPLVMLDLRVLVGATNAVDRVSDDSRPPQVHTLRP